MPGYISIPLLILFLLITIGSACRSNKEFLTAMKGKYTDNENQKIISQYCQSCHQHKDFDPESHLFVITLEYDRKPFSEADKCQTCHSISRNFWGDFKRKTVSPKSR